MTRMDENYLQIFSEQLGKGDCLDRSFASFAKEGLEPTESFKQRLPEKFRFIITSSLKRCLISLTIDIMQFRQYGIEINDVPYIYIA